MLVFSFLKSDSKKDSSKDKGFDEDNDFSIEIGKYEKSLYIITSMARWQRFFLKYFFLVPGFHWSICYGL